MEDGDLDIYIENERARIENHGRLIAEFISKKEEKLLSTIRSYNGIRFVVTDEHIGDSGKAVDFANNLLAHNDKIITSWSLAAVNESDDIKKMFENPDELVNKGFSHVGFVVESNKRIELIKKIIPDVPVFRVD